MESKPNYNCRGCGARLVKQICPYCGRLISPGDKILPQGWASNYPDPALKAQLRKVYV